MNSFDRIAEALEQILLKYLAFDPLQFVVPFFSALLGALFSWAVVHIQTKRQRKLENTQSLIDQFFSKEFIAHRVSLSKTRRAVLEGKTTTRAVALGYVYPIETGEQFYIGIGGGRGIDDERPKLLESLTEHEHLTLYLGYIQRISYRISKKLVDESALRDALKYQFKWHADFLRSLVHHAERIANEKNEERPSFCSSVDIVLNSLDLPSNKIDEKLITKIPE